MSRFELPLKRSRSLYNSVAVTDVVECNRSSSSISSSNPSSDTSSSLCSPIDSPSKHLQLPQSLLTVIHSHLVSRLLEPSLEWRGNEPRSGFLSKGVFEIHTFHIASFDLPQLCSFASFFEADVPSLFLHVYGSFNIEEFLSYSHVITGLEFCLWHDKDLEFLNKSSLIFPHLKELHVHVDYSLSTSLIELLKLNTSVTSANLGEHYIGAAGAIAISEVLKVNTTITSLNLSGNCIGAQGVGPISEALKNNDTVKCINLSGNFIGTDGARALAETLKVNGTISSIDLGGNSIGIDGVMALAEALTVNVTVTNVSLGCNFIGDEGAKALAEASKVNSKVKIEGVEQLDRYL
ncbi:hypothetical protein GEMRC1_009527 [Eukaryota sp. GEM-RC1]